MPAVRIVVARRTGLMNCMIIPGVGDCEVVISFSIENVILLHTDASFNCLGEQKDKEMCGER